MHAKCAEEWHNCADETSAAILFIRHFEPRPRVRLASLARTAPGLIFRALRCISCREAAAAAATLSIRPLLVRSRRLNRNCFVGTDVDRRRRNRGHLQSDCSTPAGKENCFLTLSNDRKSRDSADRFSSVLLLLPGSPPPPERPKSDLRRIQSFFLFFLCLLHETGFHRNCH